jgi:hypothetical protein
MMRATALKERGWLFSGRTKFLIATIVVLTLCFIDASGVRLNRWLANSATSRNGDSVSGDMKMINAALLERSVIASSISSSSSVGIEKKHFRSALSLDASTIPVAAEKKEILLSAGKPVVASVTGNLGLPSVVTSEKVVRDWLLDRWQAASDMGGTPIPGEHWIEIDLEHIAKLSRILLDWETAHATKWTLRARLYEDGGWATIALGTDAVSVLTDSQPQQHVMQQVILPVDIRARYIRLIIHEPATRWGSSLWRFQVWGKDG